MNLSYYLKFLQYIKNAGGSPSINQFDEDWMPIGKSVRRDMIAEGIMVVDLIENTVSLTKKGEDYVKAHTE